MKSLLKHITAFAIAVSLLALTLYVTAFPRGKGVEITFADDKGNILKDVEAYHGEA